jgi:hypothetical protein
VKATANVVLTTATPEVILTHGEERLTFTISVYGKANFQNEYDVFGYINQYWNSLPENKQQNIFNIYKDIQYGFDNVFDKTDLFDYLTDKVKDLIEAHDLNDIQYWVSIKSDTQIPPGFEESYAHSIDNNTSREKTYTKNDYSQLVSLSLLLRCMVPVWGEYISHIRQDAGTQFKEYFAFQLLNKSNVINSVPMTKLSSYIEHIVGADNFDANNVLNGICSEDYGYWLTALVCIRRLCLGDIRGLDPKAHLITLIYKFIIQKIRNTDNDFTNVVKEKTFDDRAPDGENKISTLERYKIKTNISLGDIVELEYSMKDIRDCASKLSSILDPNMLERSLYTSRELMQHRLLDPQVSLLRWVFKPVISPKGLMYLPKSMIVDALGALEAVLWARGHKYLAILVTSYPIISEKEMIISPVDSKMRVPKEMTDELDILYPYHRAVTDKKLGTRLVNLTAENIDTVTNNLTMFSWRPTADESMLREVFGNGNRKLPIKPDIKIDLTRLVLEIGSGSWI